MIQSLSRMRCSKSLFQEAGTDGVETLAGSNGCPKNIPFWRDPGAFLQLD